MSANAAAQAAAAAAAALHGQRSRHRPARAVGVASNDGVIPTPFQPTGVVRQSSNPFAGLDDEDNEDEAQGDDNEE